MGYVQVLIKSDEICCVVSMSILSHYLVFFEDHIHFIIPSALVAPYIDLTHIFSIIFEGIFFFWYYFWLVFLEFIMIMIIICLFVCLLLLL